MSEFAAALLRQDMAAALPLLTDDVVFFYSNGTAIIGKAAFAAVMTTSWKAVEDYRYAVHETSWLAQSETAAAVIYSFAWSGLAHGAEVGGGGRATRVFRRDRTGGLFGGRRSGWRIAHEHLSAGQWTPEAG
jgi:ketosteroid isomerase-like protein